MFYYPRFSYEGVRSAVHAVPRVLVVVCQVRCTGWVRYQGRVYRVGTGRAIPGTQRHCSRRGPYAAKRAPEGPQGLEWVAYGARTPGCRYHPLRCAPGPAPLYLHPPRAIPASWPIRATFQSNIYKVSQNHEVSPKSMHKACHSPCLQNGLGKSPLRILRFPYFVAFSHKELLTHFEA